METMITKTRTSEYGTKMFEITCGKTSAFVAIEMDGRTNVCAYNASHRVWRGAGKMFRSVAEAMANYKSAEMRAIIETAAAS